MQQTAINKHQTNIRMWTQCHNVTDIYLLLNCVLQFSSVDAVAVFACLHASLRVCVWDVDECSPSLAHLKPCDANAECTNAPGSFDCQCVAGYSGDGRTCQGIALLSFHLFTRSTPDPWLTCDHFVVKASAMGQPTRPTLPSIPSGSVNE